MLWTDERTIPPQLLALLNVPETPSNLWKEIARANNEVNVHGAVTYPTKARIEYIISTLNKGD